MTYGDSTPDALKAALLRWYTLREAESQAARKAGDRIARQGRASCGEVPTRATVLAAERALLEECRRHLRSQ